MRMVSAAIKTADRGLIPYDASVEVYYDRVDRLWYAAYTQLTNDWGTKQVGFLGSGTDPYIAVLNLQENNNDK